MFATLRAPFFQLSDDALLRLRRTGGSGGLWAGLMGAAETGGLTEAEVTAALRAGALLERWLARNGFSDSGTVDPEKCSTLQDSMRFS